MPAKSVFLQEFMEMIGFVVQQLSPSGVVSFPQGIMVAGGHDGGHQVLEEASRKRELRLLKNKQVFLVFGLPYFHFPTCKG